MSILTTTIGYPRIGKNREVKKALEGFWSGKLTAATLLQTVKTVEIENWQTQLKAGIDRIGVGDATLYDSVLDWTVRLGLIPDRFQHLSGIERYFAMARGKEGIPALEMTKWFDTNYHYLVPEIPSEWLTADFSDFIETVNRAQTLLGERAIPIVLSPITLLRLSRFEIPLSQAIAQLVERYSTLLVALKNLGVSEVQIHEPALVLGDAANFKEAFESTYAALADIGVPIQLVTYFDDLGETYPWVMKLPVAGISLDFTRGRNLELLKQYGFPADKKLGVGIVDARNVWQISASQVLPVLEAIQQVTSQIFIQPSASLQFVPYDAQREKNLPEPLRNVLSFAEQKLAEMKLLARTVAGENTEVEWQIIANIQAEFKAFNPPNKEVQAKLTSLNVNAFQRALSYSDRIPLQSQLPLFPTTTIGSFPQTSEVRQLRVKLKRGEITLEEYQQAIDVQIAECIRIQEDLGLDVLVHGEFERTDMVEFFGQQLQGYAFTEHGWVQSYGSRYVRPPIICGDIYRPAPMTVREFKVAQSLTKKPMKGMLTGPVTMINWSYVRTDISRQEQAFQIALALREEVADLEAAGSTMIQIDEPALREGLPLKPDRWNEYLAWAVDAFRLSAWLAAPDTVILQHHHMNAHILQEVDNYNPFKDLILMLECANQAIFVNLKDLPISPPNCYQNVCQKWEEFQLETDIIVQENDISM